MLSSRERVLAAIAHEAPDRTPRDFWAEPPTLNRLFDHLGHHDEERLLTDLGIDLRHLDAITPQPRDLGGGVWQNLWGERFIHRPTPWGPLREDVKGALSEAAGLDDLAAFPWPTPDCYDYSSLKEQCRRHDQYALIYGFADVWQRPALVRGWEGMFLDMAVRPDWVHFLGRRFTDFYLEDYTRAQEAAGGRIDLFLLISDLGCQTGPLISLEMFREFVAPYLREMTQRIHHLGAKALYHSCGAIHPFIADLIELGVDVLDPIQPAIPEMAPERLVAEYGGRIAFHGGIDMQRLLPHGAPQQIREEVRRYREALSPGYILAPAHLFQPDVPPENVLAVYQ